MAPWICLVAVPVGFACGWYGWSLHKKWYYWRLRRIIRRKGELLAIGFGRWARENGYTGWYPGKGGKKGA